MADSSRAFNKLSIACPVGRASGVAGTSDPEDRPESSTGRIVGASQGPASGQSEQARWVASVF